MSGRVAPVTWPMRSRKPTSSDHATRTGAQPGAVVTVGQVRRAVAGGQFGGRFVTDEPQTGGGREGREAVLHDGFAVGRSARRVVHPVDRTAGVERDRGLLLVRLGALELELPGPGDRRRLRHEPVGRFLGTRRRPRDADAAVDRTRERHVVALRLLTDPQADRHRGDEEEDDRDPEPGHERLEAEAPGAASW